MRRLAPRILTCLVAVGLSLTAGGATRPAAPTTPSDSLRALTEPLFMAGRYDSILTLLPAFIRRAEATGDSVLLGRALAQRGRVRLTLGRPDSEPDIDSSIRIAESVRDTVGLMAAVHFKGYVYTARGQYQEALRSFERRLFLAQRTHSPVDEAWARSGMAYELHLLDQHERAKEEYTRSIELFRASGLTRLEITPLIGLGRVEGALGNHDNSARCFQRAWVDAVDTGDRLNEMWALNNLGSIEYERGDLSRAEQYQQRAFDLARELKSPWAIAVPASNLASGAMELGDFETAEAFLIEARKLWETQPNAGYLGMLDLELAVLRMLQGRREAAAELLRGLTADLESLEPQHRDKAMMYRAQVLASSDSVDAAIALLSKYTEQSGRPYGTDAAKVYMLLARLHYDANHNAQALAYALRARETAQQQRDRRIVVASMLLESLCYRNSGHVDDAATTFYAALDSMEAIRGSITTPDWRETYGQQVSQDIVEAGRVLLEVPASAPQSARDEAFFDAVQRIKTRTLLDRITEPRFGNAGIEGRWSPGVATLHDVQATLRPAEVLLDFCVGAQRSFVTLVTADSMRVVELGGPSSELADRVRLFRRIIASSDAASRTQYTGDRMTAMQRSVGDDVLGSVADMVERSQRLFVSADGFFATVPFGMLILHDHGDILMADRDVVQIPSASVLVLERRTKQSAQDDGASVVAMASSNERLTGARDEVRDLARRYDNVQVVAGVDGAGGFEAAAGGCDVLHIAAHALVVDQSPWQSGFRVADIPASAADAIVPAPPRQSAAPSFLSPADSLRVARAFRPDPYVRAWQIAQLRLAARLTVLSGCETAGGRVTTGEGTLGLTAAFLSAGVPVVVSSLWPVDDRVTRLMMRSFYRHLAAGDPVATALRRSQLEIRRSSKYAHPYFWAGFTAVGEGSMGVSIEKRRFSLPDGALVAAVATAILVALLFALRRRRPSQ